jgi:hypothetical protein
MKRFRLLFVPLLLVLLFIPSIRAQADTGPHPTMDFQLAWNIPRGTVLEAALYDCADATCVEPVKVPGPFTCSVESCWYNYGSEGFYKLVIVFDDRTRESNIFEKRGFEAEFVTEVNADDLHVEQTSFPIPYSISVQFLWFLLALPTTWIIETAIGIFLLKRWSLPRRWLLIILANLITLPFVWFIFPLIRVDPFIMLGLGELFAWLFEAAFYRFTMKKDGLTISRALLLSLIANLASLLLPAVCLWALFAIGSY